MCLNVDRARKLLDLGEQQIALLDDGLKRERTKYLLHRAA
jgi:hypothetical protein